MPYKNDIRHTVIGSRRRAETRYAMMLNRCKAFTKKNSCYAGVQVLIDREEFIAWFMANDFKGGSVDRIDPAKHYEAGNLQMIPTHINVAKDKIIGDATQSTCHRCKETKMADEFARDKRRTRGFSTCCKACDNKRRKRSTGA